MIKIMINYLYIQKRKYMFLSINHKSKEYNIINTNDKLNMQTFAPSMIFVNNIIHMTITLENNDNLQHIEWDTY